MDILSLVGSLLWLAIPVGLIAFILRRRAHGYRLAVISSLVGLVVVVVTNLVGAIVWAPQIVGLILIPTIVLNLVLAILICGVWCLWLGVNSKGAAND